MQYKIVLACNTRDEAEALAAVFGGIDDFALAGTASSGKEALVLMQDTGAEILVSDLFFSDMDGLALFDLLLRDGREGFPLIFAMSTIIDDRLLNIVSRRAVYCFAKPVAPERVALRVTEIVRAMSVTAPAQPTALDLMNRKISELLLSVGVPVHLKGYRYLREAISIYLLAEHPENLSVTLDIYPLIASRYDTKDILVEHAIRNAIELAWTRGNLNQIIELFGYTVNDHKGKPSNLEFIAMIAERVRISFLP